MFQPLTRASHKDAFIGSAFYLNINEMLLSRSLQCDKQDPVKVTRRLNEFTWTMSELRLIIENSLDENDDGQVKTRFKTFCLKVENDDGKFCIKV